MDAKSQILSRPTRSYFLVLALAFLVISCNTDIISDEGEAVQESCKNVSDFIFNEKDGLVNVEFENSEFSDDWKLKNDGARVIWFGKENNTWATQEMGQPFLGLKLKIRALINLYGIQL